MTDTSDITTAVHLLAIDVAKQWNVVLIETASGTRHRFKMANSAQDFERLIQFIESLGGRCRFRSESPGVGRDAPPRDPGYASIHIR
jgi:hypothetical protein